MVRSIRVRLALSYAGIALLVTLSLGAVLLIRLRAYYARMELDYLNSNAKAISGLAAPVMIKDFPKDMQDAQISNLAFLSQTRVRILDPQKHVLADSGSWKMTKVGLGAVAVPKIKLHATTKMDGPGAASVIVIQSGKDEPPPLPPEGESGLVGNSVSAPAPGEKPDVIFFNSSVPVSNGVYGLYLSKQSIGARERSSQQVVEPIIDATGSPLGFVELSEGPAYGTEIVNSVASGLAVAGGLAILLAVGVGWLTSRRVTAPLLSLTEATQQMSSGDLSARVAEADRKDEFGSLGKSFNQMAGRIEETVETLRRFLSDAAHELQTPLTALRTNLELARSEGNTPATEQYLAHALEQIERLQRMIRDLLSLSRLESANGHDVFEPINLNDLIRQTSETFAARAEQAGQSFELDLPADDSEPLVMGSAEKLRCALGNLLDNALKFTPTGGTITVRMQPEVDRLCLAVADTGIGIPPDEVEMLFNRFHRGRNAAAYPGSGLGLAIVQAVAQAHGGSVQAGNNPRGGARFTLVLPRAARVRAA